MISQELEQALLKIEGVTPIFPEDKPRFDREALTYAGAWPYIVLLGENLGTHGLGLKYPGFSGAYGPGAFITIGSHEGHICLCGELADAERLGVLARKIYSLVQAPLYVKGITAANNRIEQTRMLDMAEQGFQLPDISSGLEPIILGDDYFPYRILYLPKSLERKIDLARHSVLRQFRKASLDDGTKEDAKKVILEWGTSGKSNVIGYLHVVETYEPGANAHAMIYYVQDVPVGFFLATSIGGTDTAGLYVNIVSRHITQGRDRHRASKFFLLDFFAFLHEQGATYLNWGGSETQALDDFKCWFHPEKTQKGLVFEYNPDNLPRKS